MQSNQGLSLIVGGAALVLLAGACAGCAATTSSVAVRPGKSAALKRVQSVRVTGFSCANEIVAQAVRNVIVQELLGAGVAIVQDGQADLVIGGTITFAADAVATGAGSLYATPNVGGGSAYSVATAGAYVTGLTAQLRQGDEVLASATVTQVRTDMWIPDPPEVVARRLARKMRGLLR